jgi:hypothetical protein
MINQMRITNKIKLRWKKRRNKVSGTHQLHLIIAVTDIEKVRQEILTSTKTDLELLNSARLGTQDYDYDSLKIIKEGG